MTAWADQLDRKAQRILSNFGTAWVLPLREGSNPIRITGFALVDGGDAVLLTRDGKLLGKVDPKYIADVRDHP